MSELRWPWAALALAVALVALLVLWVREPRPVRAAVLVAHIERLRRLPRYRAVARRELLTAALRAAGAAVLVIGAVLLVARPVRAEVLDPDRSARDIELCLDVSASMDPWNEQVVERFREIAGELSGERIGLTIFSGAAVTVVPITDDYEFLTTVLDDAAASFDQGDYSFFVGAESPGKRASLVGDGLVSCTQRFDPGSDERGRAIVLASDNDPQGRELFGLEEAAAYAARRGVVVYAIAPPSVEESPDRVAGMEAAASSTGGLLAVLEDPAGVSDVVEQIERLERSRAGAHPATVELDDPVGPFRVAVLGLVLLLGATVVGGRR